MENAFAKRPPFPQINRYWERPAEKDMGSNDADVVFISVGKALSEWEKIENTLAVLFGLLTESKTHAAQRAYGAITGSHVRKQTLINAGEIFADNHKVTFKMDELELICKHYAEGAGKRNEIAHAVVTLISVDEKSKGYFLTPPSYLSKKNKAKTLPFWDKARTNEDPFFVFGFDYRYTHEDVDHFRMLFQKLGEHTNQFLMEHLMHDAIEKFDQAPDNQKASIRLGIKNEGEIK